MMEAVLAVALGTVVIAGLVTLLVLVTRRPGRLARWERNGVQAIDVLVQQHYRPDHIVVRKGVPVRINFIRNEDNPCSQRVVFSAFGINRRLPAYQTTAVEFIPDQAGEYLFTCEMGMYQGWLIVEEAPVPRAEHHALSKTLASRGPP